MKKIIFFSIISLSYAVTSQVTLQASDLNPAIGETFNVTQADYVNPGSSGANQTWDLSSLQNTGSFTINHLAANGTFAGTNLTQNTVSGAQTVSSYALANNTGMYTHGINASVLITFQNTMKTITYPLSSGVNETDNFSATFNSGGFAFTRTGTSNIVADGYGTLITPAGTFTNVVRAIITMDYTDTYSGGSFHTISTVYTWYKAGVHYPLASVSELDSDINGLTTFGQYLTTVPLGIEENTLAFSIAPNPSNSVVNIQLESKNKVNRIEVITLDGKVVRSQIIENGVINTSLDISELKDGIYILNLYSQNNELLGTSKIIKD